MPDEEKESTKKIRLQYFKPENYKPVYVNGAYGGVTPRGDLLCHFFYEHIDVPDEEIGPVVEGKLDINKLERKDRVKHEPNELVVRRDIRVGVIIPVHQVRNIAEWMMKKVKESSVTVEEKTDAEE